MASNEVRFTVKLNVDGQTKVVDATASVEELGEAIAGVREVSDGLGLSKGWEGMMLGVNAAMDVIGKLKGTLDDLAGSYESWETSMAAVNTMAGKDAAGLAELASQVSELSKTIPKAREELAEGLYQTISNGVPEADWLTFLEQSARASVGGIADLGETVKVTSTVIKNYGMDWSQAGEIQDKIQATAKNGVTSFGELASALPRVTANAATLGVTVDELMATFATLTGVSGNTAEVSTQLAAIFTALVKPSSEAAKMAEAMGIEFDAAAIKGAGGMQKFLTQLDATVKEYAKAHGMLEQEIYGSLFGSAESLRALIPLTGELKEKFVENVGAMGAAAGTCEEACDQMSSTGAAQMQLLKNAWLSLIEPLGAVASGMRPLVNGLMSVGQAGLYLHGLTQSFLALRNAHVLATASTIAHSAATKVLGTVSAATGVSVNVLKVAVRGLMIATGVGAVISALTFVVEKLAGASDKAAASERNLAQASESVREAEEAGAQAAASAKAEMDKEIQKLDELIKSKGDTTAAVQELNNKYGEWFGQCSTAQQWYDTLIKNSEAYCNQLAYEAQMRVYYEKKAQLEVKRERNRQKQLDLIDSGKGRENRMGGFGQIRGAGTTKFVPSEELKDLVKEEGELSKDIEEEEKNITTTKNLMASNKPVGPGVTVPRTSTGGTGKTGATGKTGKPDKTEPPIPKEAFGWYDEEISKLEKKKVRILDPEALQDLDRLIERLKYGKSLLEMKSVLPKADREKFDAMAKSGTSAVSQMGNDSVLTPKLAPPSDYWISQVAKDWLLGQKAMKDYFAEFKKQWKLTGGYQAKANDATDEHNKKLSKAGGLVQSFGQSFATIGKNMEQPVLEATGIIAQAIASMLLGYAQATAEGAKLGPIGWAALALSGLATVTTVIEQMKDIGQYAEGALAFGPTLGIFGEYSGARSNPEVVAPLDKLRSYMGAAGGVQEVRFRIKCRDFWGMSKKAGRYYRRMG